MSKRWATWPRGIRWLAGIAIVVLALAIVWVLFVPLADWLARHEVGPVKGALHETAVDNARGRLPIGASMVAVKAACERILSVSTVRSGVVVGSVIAGLQPLLLLVP
jgi:hypothetical protein